MKSPARKEGVEHDSEYNQQGARRRNEVISRHFVRLICALSSPDMVAIISTRSYYYIATLEFESRAIIYSSW
jgi:hypothetical protein